MAGGTQGLALNSGPQDLVLTGNPEVTFFKLDYKRTTNCAIEYIECQFNGTVNFGGKGTVPIPRSGDLVHKMELRVDMPALTGTGTQAWVRNVGHALIEEVELIIGSSRVDKHYGQFMHIWNELTQTSELQDTFNIMIGNTTEMTTEATTIPATTLQIPLGFWFNRQVGQALPLIALQYHDVKLEFKFRPFSELHVSSSGTVTVPTLTGASVWADYIFIDTDERREFAQVPHEYLIEELQFAGTESFSQTNIKQRLNFNHPCKALFWVSQLDSNVQTVAAAGGAANRWFDFTDNGTGPNPYNGSNPVVNGKLQLNGADRFTTQIGAYFNQTQPLHHWTRGPATGINSYSFGFKPEDHQPSGTLNFSRVDNATLILQMTSSASMKLYTYVINYNIAKIWSGMFGKHYSN